MTASEERPKTVALAGNFFPVPLESIDFSTLAIDLYILHASAREPTLYRNAGLPFRESDAKRLIAQDIRFLYIPTKQHALYRRALCEHVDKTFTDPAKARAERARVVRETCGKMIEDALLYPGRAETIQAIGEMSRTFATWVDEPGSELSYLFDMSAHDYYTVTHMVNVGVGCGLLVRELRPNDPELFALVTQGGLLHDLGKRDVPSEILNKQDRLTSQEWDLLRTHPQAGYDELCQHPSVTRTVLEMTLDHHEHLDGSGYPAGKRGDEISFVARICAVVDVYDALTAARPYRGPMAPADALNIMREGVGRQFDEKVFEAWENLVTRLVREDPDRAVKESGEGVPASLEDADPQPLVSLLQVDEQPPMNSDERRKFPRYTCRLSGSAIFLRRGKQIGARLGEEFRCEVTDLSQAGAQVNTSFPLSRGDLLTVQFLTKSGGIVKRAVEVVRVRQGVCGWVAGTRFVANAGAKPVGKSARAA